jgi:NTP pyrophosphatase (non-canonical NTP hydrolase)
MDILQLMEKLTDQEKKVFEEEYPELVARARLKRSAALQEAGCAWTVEQHRQHGNLFNCGDTCPKMIRARMAESPSQAAFDVAIKEEAEEPNTPTIADKVDAVLLKVNFKQPAVPSVIRELQDGLKPLMYYEADTQIIVGMVVDAITRRADQGPTRLVVRAWMEARAREAEVIESVMRCTLQEKAEAERAEAAREQAIVEKIHHDFFTQDVPRMLTDQPKPPKPADVITALKVEWATASDVFFSREEINKARERIGELPEAKTRGDKVRKKITEQLVDEMFRLDHDSLREQLKELGEIDDAITAEMLLLDKKVARTWQANAPKVSAKTVIVEREIQTTLNALRDECHAASASKGWWDTKENVHADNIPQKLMLIVSEAAEALEDFREGKMEATYVADVRGNNKPCGFPSEMADIIIRCFDLAGWLKIDLDKAVREKIDYNATRLHLHGGKKA